MPPRKPLRHERARREAHKFCIALLSKNNLVAEYACDRGMAEAATLS